MKRAPTQRQIRERCKKVQESWSEEERLSRIADYRLRPGYKDTWIAPTYSLPDEEEGFQKCMEMI